jgi:hypothetical protein
VAVPSSPGCPVDCVAASLMEGIMAEVAVPSSSCPPVEAVAEASQSQEAEAVVPLSLYQLVKAAAAAASMEGRVAEAVVPLSLYQLVKVAAAAAASSMKGRVAQVVVPSRVQLELAASPSWTDGTWANIAMAPCLERVGEQPWPGLGLGLGLGGLEGASA